MNRTLTILLRHWKPLLAWNLGLAILAAGALARSKPIWVANTTFILSANSGKLSANLGALGQVSDSTAFFSQQVNPLNVLSSIVMSDDTMGALQQVDPQTADKLSLSRYKGFFKVMAEESSTEVDMWLGQVRSLYQEDTPEVQMVLTESKASAGQQQAQQL
jgi:polysaccharide biosynthesis transport protein